MLGLFLKRKKKKGAQKQDYDSGSIKKFYKSLEKSQEVHINDECGTVLGSFVFDFPPPLPRRLDEIRPPARPPVSY